MLAQSDLIYGLLLLLSMSLAVIKQQLLGFKDRNDLAMADRWRFAHAFHDFSPIVARLFIDESLNNIRDSMLRPPFKFTAHQEAGSTIEFQVVEICDTGRVGVGTMPDSAGFFWRDDHLYVSPNVKAAPNATLLAMQSPFSEPPSPAESLMLRVSSNKYPFLGFTMTSVHYSHVLLTRLNHTFRSLPIVYRRGEWFLEENVVRQWEDLECSLIDISNFLFNHFQIMLPADVAFFPFPSSYGFARGRPHEHQMRRGAMKARAAFGPLMALCSYLIALTPLSTAEHPPWAASLMDRDGLIRIPPAWVDDFRSSPVADFSVNNPRVGTVMTPDCQFMEYLPNFVRANVPVWILWTRSAWYSDVPTVDRYRPNILDVREAYRKTGSTQKESCVVSSRINVGPLEEPPDVEPMSGQFKGESPEEFFSRRQQTSYSRQHVPLLWSGIPNAQRRYDGLSDEWDVYKPWDVSTAVDDNFDNIPDNECSPTDVIVSAPSGSSITGNVSLRNTAGYARDLGDAYSHLQRTNDHVAVENLDVLLRFRFGYNSCGYAPDPSLKRNKVAADWAGARKVLNDVHSDLECVEDQEKVVDFVTYVLSQKVPPTLWDFDPSSHHPINPVGQYVRVVRLTNRCSVIYEVVPNNFTGCSGNLNWRLVVDNALTALECIRRSTTGITKTDFVNFFLASGRQFNTQSFVYSPPPPRLPPARTQYSQGGLGARHDNYESCLADYIAYERKRDAFLLCDRARAAVMKGGIIWRLTVHAIDRNLVLDGPVDITSGLYSRMDGEQYGSWDDELTDDELHLITGVYKIFTGT
ncbi:hypothetical protein HWV62_4936 [Athelia sp. TMB]|nr:hypothetical protein HWV62_4936 [Athelia sp. TMB]